MATIRTFVALASDDALQRRAAGLAARLRPQAPGARWVETENLHLTLMFMGDLPDRDVAEVCRRVEWTARANEPFSLEVRGVGAFPDPLRPRALWLGAGEGADAVCRLQADLDEALGDLAPRGENRNFHPHWTLARLGGTGRAGKGRPSGGGSPGPQLTAAIASLADYAAGSIAVDEVVVYGSELRPEGPEYYALATCGLGMGKG
jgi:2'-5' RNA ligase